MKHLFFSSFFLLVLASSTLQSLGTESLFNSNSPNEEPRIFVNNRILTRVNGKPISTYDLMKKMDLTFFRLYPEYSSSNTARFQYYDMSWRYVLEDIIDKELILADAEESKIELSTGDVRQEMESSFGPNIILNLDKAGMTYDEAAKIMQEELVIRRMISGRVHAKALRQVTPSKIKIAYEEYIQDPANARLTQWAYQIVTIKERNLPKTEETSKAAYRLLMEGTPLDQLSLQLKELKIFGRKGSLTVSKVIKQNDKEISPDYRSILTTLDTGMYSQPFVHKSRTNNATVCRILIVNEKTPGGLPTYKEMENTLKNALLDNVIEQETNIYLQKLRQHYHIQAEDIDASIPQNYKPFILKTSIT